MVDPAPLPIYFRLHRCKPWVAEDGFVFTEVGKEELERDGGGSGSYIQDSIVSEDSASVFHPIDVEQLSGFWELLNGESEPFGVGEVHKVLGSS